MIETRIFGLDFLRFLAISLVILGHGVQLLPSFPNATQYSRMIDYLGVELFFVLSGYLIGGIFIKKFSEKATWHELTIFWKRRWWRTLPNYYLFLCINILGIWIFSEDFEFDWRYLFFLQNAILPDQHFFSVSWSLTIEEFFYLSVPLLFLIFLKLPCSFSTSFWLLVAFILLGSVFLRFQYIISGEVTWNDEMRRVMVLRMDSLMYGVIMAWLSFKYSNLMKSCRLYLILPGFIMLGLSVWFRHHPDINSNSLMLLFIFPAASVGAALFLPFLSNWSVCNRGGSIIIYIITSISLWSYSLYLIHVPAIEFFQIIFSQVAADNPVLQGMFFLLWLTLSVAGSAFLYRYFEQPLTAMRDKDSKVWLRRSKALNEIKSQEICPKSVKKHENISSY